LGGKEREEQGRKPSCTRGLKNKKGHTQKRDRTFRKKRGKATHKEGLGKINPPKFLKLSGKRYRRVKRKRKGGGY